MGDREDLPAVWHKAGGGQMVRAQMGEVLGVELQPEVQLLGAVEAP